MYFCSEHAVYIERNETGVQLIKPSPINLYIHTYVKQQVLKIVGQTYTEKEKRKSQKNYLRRIPKSWIAP